MPITKQQVAENLIEQKQNIQIKNCNTGEVIYMKIADFYGKIDIPQNSTILWSSK